MIGRFTFDDGGEPAVAELDDELNWSVPGRPGLQDVLNHAFDPRRDLSPASGSPGFSAFHEAAEFLRGTVEFLAESTRTRKDDRLY